MATEPKAGPLACVLGDMDLVRPLGLAGIRCAVVGPPGGATAHSRFTERLIPGEGGIDDVLVDRLLRFGAAQAE